MREDNPEGEPAAPPRNVLPDLIIPVLALVFTGYYWTTITDVPWTSQASAVTVGTLLLVSIAALFVRTAIRVRLGTETIRFEGPRLDWPLVFRRGALLALTIAYVWIIGTLGFTLTTLLFLFLGIVLLSSVANWRMALAVSFGCSSLGYFVFIHLFQTRFPKGWIERMLEQML